MALNDILLTGSNRSATPPIRMGLSLLALSVLGPVGRADSPAGPGRLLQSPRGSFHIMLREKPDGAVGQLNTVFIVSNRHARVVRQLMPQRIEGATDTDHTGFAGDFYISPDDQWIFREEKYVHTISVACLYKRHGEADYRPALPLRFDEAAWRYYAARRGWERSAIPTVAEGPRIIDFVSWSRGSRRLVFRLRPIKGYSQASGSGWLGYYDTVTGKFGAMPRVRKRARK